VFKPAWWSALFHASTPKPKSAPRPSPNPRTETPQAYILKRSNRRTIGFRIDDRGLTVTAPERAPIVEIERALQAKSAWIERKLREWKERPTVEGSPSTAAEIRALKRQAKTLLSERLAQFHQRHGCAPTRWSLSSARTRWGSCSASGHVRLNWRLVHLPIELVDYVIAHELAHLSELNHSPRFWQRVEALYPSWREHRAALRAYRLALD